MTNIMQRVFDALAHPQALAVEEISAALHITDAMVENALNRLRRQRCIRTTFDGETWRYSVKKGSERPPDNRGRKRK
jgi:DNA-binding IclR family transcriptional regulator